MASVAVYYFFMEQQAVKQANLFYAQADSKSAFKVHFARTDNYKLEQCAGLEPTREQMGQRDDEDDTTSYQRPHKNHD